MPKKPKSDSPRRPSRLFLREWLDHRGKTQDKLADEINTGKSVVSKLVTGEQRYNQDWLERIAFVLKCEVRELFKPPRGGDQLDEILEHVSSLPDQKRALLVSHFKSAVTLVEGSDDPPDDLGRRTNKPKSNAAQQ